MNATAWMKKCPECIRIWREFDGSTKPHQVDAAIRTVLAHIVKDHAEHLPARRVGCTKCAEFARARSYPPRIVTPTIRAVLERADLEHLAGHLWDDSPFVTARRQAAA